MTKYQQGAVLPHVERAARELGQRFAPPVIGGMRADTFPGSYHPLGRALDLMVYNDRAKGDAIAQYAWANRDRLGVIEVIWQQRIITTKRAGEGWRAMSDRGGATANHRDHVHLSFTATGGKGGSSLGDALGDAGQVLGGPLGGSVLGDLGSKAGDAASAALSPLDSMAGFFVKLGDQRTWVRVLQVVGGAVLIVGGVAIIGRSTIAGTATEAVMTLTPAGRAASVVGAATKGATGAAAKAAKAVS